MEGIEDIQHGEIERLLRLLPDDLNQPPGVVKHPIRDMEQVYGLDIPDRGSGLNCSFRYSRSELPRIKRAFKGRGIVNPDVPMKPEFSTDREERQWKPR